MNTTIHCSTSLSLGDLPTDSIHDWTAVARLLERGGFDLVCVSDAVADASLPSPSADALAAVEALLSASTYLHVALRVRVAEADPQRWADYLVRLRRSHGNRFACALDLACDEPAAGSRMGRLATPRADVFLEALKEYSGVHAGKSPSAASPLPMPLLALIRGGARDKSFAARHAQAVVVAGSELRALGVDIADMGLLSEEAGRRRERPISLLTADVITAASNEEAQTKAERAREQQRWWQEHVASAHRERGPHAALRCVGTPDVVARQLIQWVDATEARGVHLAGVSPIETLQDFVELVVPELRARDRHRLDYAHGTRLLTDHTLPNPVAPNPPTHTHPALVPEAPHRRSMAVTHHRLRSRWAAFLRQ
jgi:alkanesulfonate monooxygenase SsuD/methylene tetrahydromethanopterin reductase-like flavin-dependent oxidoreductase (luciferase family)